MLHIVIHVGFATPSFTKIMGEEKIYEIVFQNFQQCSGFVHDFHGSIDVNFPQDFHLLNTPGTLW